MRYRNYTKLVVTAIKYKFSRSKTLARNQTPKITDMDLLNVTIIQSDLVWENPEQNRVNFSNKLKALAKTDVLILPEMFTTGFTMNPVSIAEKMDGITIAWMQTHAKQLDAAVAGSLVIAVKGKYFNRFVWANPNGTLHWYDKHQLFTLANEHKAYSAGNEQTIVDYKGWKIRLFVCYDLRFPVWSRRVNDYDVAIYVASWPSKRVSAWKTLLEARAIENMSYVVGVNRIGTDQNGLEYSGASAIYDPWGTKLTHTKEHTETTESVDLSLSNLKHWRKSFSVLNDADTFELKR